MNFKFYQAIDSPAYARVGEIILLLCYDEQIAVLVVLL